MEVPETILPGRENRKLRAHIATVGELRLQGYSVTGVHKVLAARGIFVSRATVGREFAKMAVPPQSPWQSRPFTPKNPPALTPQEVPTQSLREIRAEVDEFFKNHNSNPLFNRKKSTL
jgi:hypothetical protein